MMAPHRHRNGLARVPRRREPIAQQPRPSRVQEQFVFDSEQFGFKKKQVVDEVFDGIDRVGQRGKGRADGMQYLGSVPILVAQIWAKECGAPIGSKEHTAYAKRQIYDGEWSKLKVYFR